MGWLSCYGLCPTGGLVQAPEVVWLWYRRGSGLSVKGLLLKRTGGRCTAGRNPGRRWGEALIDLGGFVA